MRKLIVSTFVSLDGVMQAPGGPADDPTARSLNAAIAALKAEPGHDLQIIGSGNLIQSLQAAELIDEYNVWTFPVILGRGRRLFEATARPCALRLVRTQTSTTGVVMSTYVPAGEIQPGSFAHAEPSAKELERRAGMAREGG